MDVPWIQSFITSTRGNRSITDTGKGIVNPTNAYSSTARSITQMPYKPKSGVTRKGRGRKTSGGKGPARPRKRINKKRKATRKGSFKKAKRPRKLDNKSVKRHFDDYGTLTRNHALYIGFEAHGSKIRMWDIIGESVVKAVFAKMKVYPRSYDEPIGLTNFDQLDLTFKRVNVPTGTDEFASTTIDFGATATLATISADMSNRLRTRADVDVTASLEAYFLDGIVVKNTANPDINQIRIKDVGESMISLKCSQLIKLQNLTPNDAGTRELDVLGTNPIAGMKYEFKNHRAKLISEIQALNPSYDQLQVNTDTGYLPGFDLTDDEEPLVHPPKARQLFTNCSGSTSVSMAPGAFKSDRTSFSMVNKMSTFVERIYYGGFDKGSWGGVTWFAFERTHRQVGTTAELLNPVKLGFNRELMMSASCVLKTQKSMLKHYDNTPLGAIVPA